MLLVMTKQLSQKKKKKSLSTFIYLMKPRTRQHFQALHEPATPLRTSMKRFPQHVP